MLEVTEMGNGTPVIAGCVVVILAILAFLYLGAPSVSPTEKGNAPAQVDEAGTKAPVQGNIQRKK